MDKKEFSRLRKIVIDLPEVLKFINENAKIQNQRSN